MKVTFADFYEYALGIQLLEFQKLFLNKLYEKMKRGEKIEFRLARGSSRHGYLLILILMPTLIEYYEKENT